MMDDLAAFVKARLDEDEATARGLAGTTWTAKRLGDHDYEIWVTPEPLIHATAPTAGIADVQREDVAEWIAARDPRRGLREVAAKRRIAARHRSTWNDYRDGDGIERASHECAECEPSGSPDDWPCETIRAVAAVWSDHPDYRQEWAPR